MKRAILVLAIVASLGVVGRNAHATLVITSIDDGTLFRSNIRPSSGDGFIDTMVSYDLINTTLTNVDFLGVNFLATVTVLDGPTAGASELAAASFDPQAEPVDTPFAVRFFIGPALGPDASMLLSPGESSVRVSFTNPDVTFVDILPEPSTLALGLIGALGTVGYARHRKRSGS